MAVGGKVTGYDGLALGREVTQPDGQPVEAEPVGRLVQLRLDRPVDLRGAESAECRRGRRVRQNGPGVDPGRRDRVRAARQVVGLRDDPLADVGVGAEQVVAGDVVVGDAAVGAESGPYADDGGRAADRLEGLLEGEDKPAGAAAAAGQDGEQRLELGVLLAAATTAGVGREHPHMGERQVEQVGHHPLQQVGVLHGAVDGQPAVVVGHGDRAVGFDREVGDHRERVRVLDDQVGGLGAEVAPLPVALLQDVRAGQRVAGAQRGILDQRGVCGQGGLGGQDRRQHLMVHGHAPCRFFRRVPRGRYDGGDSLAVVLGLLDRQDGPVGVDRPEAGHRLRQVIRGDDLDHSGHLEGAGGVDAVDPGARAVEGDELDVQHPLQPQVGEERLLTGDAVEAAEAAGRGADGSGRGAAPIRVERRGHWSTCPVTTASRTGASASVGGPAGEPPARWAAARTAAMIRL